MQTACGVRDRFGADADGATALTAKYVQICTERRNTMDVDLIFKIAAVGIIVAVLNLLLSRSGRDEQALMITLAGLVCVLVIIVQEINSLFELIKSLFGF